jgi:hypothetical protein
VAQMLVEVNASRWIDRFVPYLFPFVAFVALSLSMWESHTFENAIFETEFGGPG